MNKKMNMETTADDLLMLPDIDGIVKDIKGQKTISGQSKADSQEKPSEDVPADTDNAPASDGGSSWEVFLRCSQGYDYRVRNDDRRVYPIDNDYAHLYNRTRTSSENTSQWAGALSELSVLLAVLLSAALSI